MNANVGMFFLKNSGSCALRATPRGCHWGRNVRLRESSCEDSHPNTNRGCNLLIRLGSEVRQTGFVITPPTYKSETLVGIGMTPEGK